MEAGRFGSCEEQIRACGSKEGMFTPLSRFPQGKAGAGGFPPRRKNGGSPRKRASPLARSPKRTRKISVDRERPLMEAVCVKAHVWFSAGCRAIGIPTATDE